MYNIDPKKKHHYIKFISFVMLVIVLLLTFCVFLYHSVIDSILESREESINIVNETNYEKLNLCFLSLYNQAKTNSKRAADEIKKSIATEYTEKELEELESLMRYGKYDDKFISILEDSIRDIYLNGMNNYNNDLHIATHDGILIDYSYNSAVDNKLSRSWREEKQNQNNKKLFNTSLKKLINQERGLIVVERNVNYVYSELYKEYDNFTMDTIKEIYKEQGLEGFKRYTFIVPTYVYEHSDIFGKEDVVSGQRQDNHKLIVIQEFNLYDQITYEYEALFKNNNIPLLSKSYDGLLALLYGLGLVLSVVIIGFIFFIASLYNWIMIFMSKMEEDSVEDKEEEDNIRQ